MHLGHINEATQRSCTFLVFLNELCPIQDPHEMMMPKNSCSRIGGVDSHLHGQSSKKNEALRIQKSGACLIYHYSANPPLFEQKRQELAQDPKCTSKGCCNKMRAYIRIPGGLLFMWGVVPSFRFHFLVATSQKTQFWYSKNGKALFVG
jgi:hypothetical protein